MALSGNQVTGLSVLGVPMRTSPLLRGVIETIIHIAHITRQVLVSYEDRIVEILRW